MVDVASPGKVQMRDLNAARTAYAEGDIEASKAAHGVKTHSEGHSKVGGHIKCIVFGGMDGIITTFAVVAGANGGGLSTAAILIMGFSNVFADALSMGVGEALSTKSENEYILLEKKREEWELENNPEGEIEEMVDLYVEKGMARDDAQLCIEKMAKYPKFFVNVMMVEELELQVPDEDENPWIEGAYMFGSFVFFGTIPLLAYIIFASMGMTQEFLFAIACCITGVALFGLGVGKSRVTKQIWWQCGLEVLCLGGGCAVAAYLIGALVHSALGVPA